MQVCTNQLKDFYSFDLSFCGNKVFRNSSDSKRFDPRQKLCCVCFSSRSLELFQIDYCCSLSTRHLRREVCDVCLYQHVLSQLHSCLTNLIQCPERDCSAYLSSPSICEILLINENDILLENYLREQKWKGKTDQWIHRFTIPCPGCQVHIEKNGGCDEMICIRCQTHFYWSLAKRNYQTKQIHKQQSAILIHPFIDGILLVILLLFLILSSVIYFK